MAVFLPASFPPNEFWDFSTRLYARGRVGEACLALQNRLGLDVNVLLFCCWVATSGRGGLRDGELAQALDAVESWSENVVRPLRALRQHLKGDIGPAPRTHADDLRRVIVECELHAEHILQLTLHGSIPRPGTGTMDRRAQARAATDNIHLYLAALGLAPAAADRDALAEILINAFPELPAVEVGELAAG